MKLLPLGLMLLFFSSPLFAMNLWDGGSAEWGRASQREKEAFVEAQLARLNLQSKPPAVAGLIDCVSAIYRRSFKTYDKKQGNVSASWACIGNAVAPIPGRQKP